MFKRIILMAVCLCVFFGMMASSASAQQVMRLGMGDPIDSDQGAFAQRFKEVVEELSNGEIRVELFPGGVLGQEPEMLQNVRMGQLEVAIVAVGNVAPFIPQYAALSYPYLIETHYDAVKATTGYLGNYWNEISKEKGGFEILGWTYSNFRYVTNSRRPVCNLEDIKGMKIRVPQNRVIIAAFDAWGANPVPMAWGETFTALQQGVVDGQENPYIVNHTMKFHEVQDYISETHYQYSLQPMIIGVNTLANMDDETREIITRAGIEAQQYGLLFQVLEAEKAKEAMQAEGVEVCELEDEDKWREIAMEKVWPEYYDFVGGKEVIDTMREHLGK